MSEDILRKAIQTYGKDHQLLMAIEEMSELTKAICNYNRGRESNIAEEMADVYIMMAQLEIIFNNSNEVGMWIKLKTDRLNERLKYDKAREKYKRPDDNAG